MDGVAVTITIRRLSACMVIRKCRKFCVRAYDYLQEDKPSPEQSMNQRNGSGAKTVLTDAGPIQLDIRRIFRLNNLSRHHQIRIILPHLFPVVNLTLHSRR